MKRIVGAIMVLILCVGMIAPVNTQAATTTVKVSFQGKTRTYSKKKTSLLVNGTTTKVAAMPIFMKNGCYMGPAAKIFKKSSLQVSIKYSENGNVMTMQYGSNILRMTSGKKKAELNGVSHKLAAAPMNLTYVTSGKNKWVVPLKSVCSALGITYKLTSAGIIKISGTSNSELTAEQTTVDTTVQGGQIVLVLDAGHGGSDSGATGNGYREKDLTLSILLGAKKYFDQDARFKVYYTRTTDTYPSLSDRSSLANDNNADIFISIHINSASSSARGTETLYNPNRNLVTAKNNVTSTELATAIHSSVVATTGFTNRGLKVRTGLHVLNKTNMPACLIEYGFISNSTEAMTMHMNTERYGKELYDAIVAFYQAKGRIQ